MSVDAIANLAGAAKDFDANLAILIARYGHDKYPTNKIAFTTLADLYLSSDDMAGYSETIERHKAHCGEDDTYFHNLGVLSLHDGKLAEAIGYFEKAMEIQPRIDSLGDLSLQSYILGRAEDTKKHCNEILKTEFHSADYGDIAKYLLSCIEDTPEHQKAVQDAIAEKPFEFFYNIFRILSLRAHRAIEDFDDKAQFERMTRAANVPVSRPQTFIFPDDGDGEINLENGAWISKPALGHGGQEVEIKGAPCNMNLSDGRLIQAYIDNPCLLFGKKFHVRVHFTIADFFQSEVFLHKDGIVRLAPNDFDHDFSNPRSHITNTSLHGVPETQDQTLFQNLDTRLVRTLREFLTYMEQQQGVSDIFDKIRTEVKHVVDVLRAENGMFDRITADWKTIPPVYMGVDLVIDDQFKVWVLELQKRPAIGGQWPMMEFILPFFRDMYHLIHNRPENGQPDENIWVRV